MKDFSRLTPEGTKDVLYADIESQNQITHRLRTLFSQRGYREVRTPALEYYDIFQSRRAHFAQESLYKLSDHTGRLLVLRPDSTIPMARLAATKLRQAPTPLRLFYCQSVFRISRSLDGLSHEQAQMGLEIIGSESIKSDLEILSLAAGLLQDLGFADFRLEIGHVLPAQALLQALPLEEAAKEDIAQALIDRNESALADLLAPCRDQQAARLLARLPRLFGSGDVLSQALVDLGDAYPEVSQALQDLGAYHQALVDMGFGKHVLIDLGLVHETDYYTGLVFRAYLGGTGRAVLSGGRYDQLLEEFGSPRPAIGLGVEVGLLAEAWSKQRPQTPPAPILYYAAADQAPQALAAWPQAPGPVIFSVAPDLAAARQEARDLGAQALWIYDPQGLQKEEVRHA